MRLIVVAAEVDTLEPLPELATGEEEDGLHDDDAPFPGDAGVLEDLVVDDGNIEGREDRSEAGHNRPEEEFVLIRIKGPGVENVVPAVVRSARAATEERASELYHFPSEEEGEPGQGNECGCTGAEDEIAFLAVCVIAISAEVAVAEAVHDEEEGG